MPEAATSPISPGATVCAKPRPTPPTTAVPQSGPITSRPRSAAMSLSVISCSTGMLSEKIMTSQPASSASIASANACRPGTETSTSPGPPRLAAAAVVRGGCCTAAPSCGAGRGARAVSTATSAPASVASSLARTAMSRSFGPACGGAANPISASRPRFSSVAMAISAASTPSAFRTSVLACISVTESA